MTDSYSQRLLSEQTRMLYETGRGPALAALFNASLLVFVLWPVVDQLKLFVWWLACVLVTVIRLMTYRSYLRKSISEEELPSWVRRYIIGVFVAAGLWSVAIIFLFPEDSIGHQVFVAFVIAGTSAGAVTSLSFMKPPVMIYLLLTLIPLSTQFLLLGTKLSIAMALMVALYLLVTLANAMRMYKNTAMNIELRFRAADSERALRQSEERYRTIFESAPLGVIHYDSNGMVVDGNPVSLRMFGNIHSGATGLSLYGMLSDEKAHHALDVSLKGEIGIYSGDLYFNQGQEALPVRIYFRGISADDGEIIGGVAIIEDRSEDRRVERLKNEFVSTVSHELRTPLTAIRGALGLLRSERIKQQPETVEQLLENANRNSDRLLALINDILDIDKIEQGKLKYNITPHNLMSLIDLAVEQNKTYAHQHKVTIVVKERKDQFVVEVDEQRFMQVMSNLLSNAVKFSHENGQVQVSVTQFSSKDEVCISVRDYGIGIPESFQDKLFERFSQFDGSDIRKTGGTGLGLSITKAIVEHHNGRLAFESWQGEGTRFDLILPCKTAAS